jgi:hypothetical protein
MGNDTDTADERGAPVVPAATLSMDDLETVTEALRPVWWDLIRRPKVSAAGFVGAQINVWHDEFVQRHNRLLVGAEWGRSHGT